MDIMELRYGRPYELAEPSQEEVCHRDGAWAPRHPTPSFDAVVALLVALWFVGSVHLLVHGLQLTTTLLISTVSHHFPLVVGLLVLEVAFVIWRLGYGSFLLALTWPEGAALLENLESSLSRTLERLRVRGAREQGVGGGAIYKVRIPWRPCCPSQSVTLPYD
jgi:hypothetical protein